MILKKTKIANFLSITGAIEFDLDSNATILLGANDHGKSNILKAICCLNEDTPIQKSDVNWDATDDASVRFEFEFSEFEDTLLRKAARAEILRKRDEGDDNDEEDGEAVDESSPKESKSPEKDISGEKISDDDDIGLEIGTLLAELDIEFEPKRCLSLSRAGAGKPLCIGSLPIDGLSEEMASAIRDMIPRAELFSAVSGELQDSVTADQITTDKFEFLQGVFFYAGINPFESSTPKLFTQDDRSERRLDDASKLLDRELRGLWAQGVDLDLHFELRHRQGAIEFLANDPAVKRQKARMSKRSAGVTQFFRLSMVLHARRKRHPANSYIYLFDEPGVFLHPKGQKDLIQVFEQLSDEAQILYATHSLFMLNQNFPERHRLITRDAGGTKVDQKPYRANWKLATDALGVHLTANILFSPAVLLVEGDSDPLYVYELFRELNSSSALDADANMLGVLSYNGDLPNLRYLLQTFKDNQSTRIVVLYDGDRPGKALQKLAKELCTRLTVETVELANNKSIEDYILFPEHFTLAVEDTIRLAAAAENTPLPENLQAQILEKWEAAKAIETTTRGKWFKDISKEFLAGQEASKVALARNYAFRCRDQNIAVPEGADRESALALCKKIATALKLPGIKAEKSIEI